jgi:tetratricopeptide (TPR) repeat protein
VLARVHLATCHAELGTFAAGTVLGEEGLQIAEAVAQAHSVMLASWGIGQLALRQGDVSRALPVLERAVSLCQELELPVYFPGIVAALGTVYTLSGRVADAVPLLMQAMEQTMATESVYQALCGLSLGEAQLLAGRLEEAHTLAEQTLMHARQRQERGHEAYALRLRGEIAAHRAPWEVEPAEAHYRQARALASELGMRPLQAHCHRGLGNLYLKSGRLDEARAELATAIDLYRPMGMTFWLPQAETALAQVEGR